MKAETVKTVLSRLNRDAFAELMFDAFRRDYGEKHFQQLGEAGWGVFRRELSDNHYPPDEEKEDGHYGIYEGAYVIHHLPHDLLDADKCIATAGEPDLRDRLRRTAEHYSHKRGHIVDMPDCSYMNPCLQGIYFITNLPGRPKGFYTTQLMPRYKDIAKSVGLSAGYWDIGCPESFPLSHVEASLENLIALHTDGLCVCLARDRCEVTRFATENELTTGVARVSRCPYQPVFTAARHASAVMREFSDLLKREPSESKLEKFLAAHYRDVFGERYSQIETQLWLRFPSLDIAGTNRRLDIFLRNCISNDWELFELKRLIPLTSTYRDIPVLTKEISFAVAQLKNYERILRQDTVKRRFAQEGIEYFEPVLHLVVGRKPQIPTKQWRWLLANCTSDVRLLTYDDLLTEMKVRYDERRQAEQDASEVRPPPTGGRL